MHELFTASESVCFTKSQSWSSSHPGSSLAYNHGRRFFPERLLSFFKVCLLQMSSVLMFSWMQLLWQNNGARCQTWERCLPKKLEKIHIVPLHLFIFENCWQFDFFWVILTFDWNKASSIYQQEGLVCWYCLLFAVRVLNTILNHSTTTISQVLYLLEEMDQKLDRQMSYPATQLSVKHPTLFSTTSWFKWFVNMLLFVRRTWVPTDKLAWNNKQRPLLSGLPWVSLSDGHQETLWTNRF